MRVPRFDAIGWPNPTQRTLLEACLGEDPSGVAAAWQAWKRLQVFEQIDLGSSRLMPLLLHQLKRFGLNDPEAGRYAGLQRRTWVTRQLIVSDLIAVRRGLEAKGISLLLLKGSAVGPLFYTHPDHRPSSDGDVLVPHTHARAAMECLVQLGWRPALGRTVDGLVRFQMRTAHSYGFVNSAGRFLDLHWRLTRLSRESALDQRFWQTPRTVALNGVEFHTLTPTHHLFHTCVHGVPFNQVPSFRWVADARKILQHSGAEVDWNEMVRCARDYRCAVILWHALAFLVEVLGASIPPGVLTELQTLSDEDWQWRELDILTGKLSPKVVPAIWHSYRRQYETDPAKGERSFLSGLLDYACSCWELEHPEQLPRAVCQRLWWRWKGSPPNSAATTAD